jgi:hypothetical protein
MSTHAPASAKTVLQDFVSVEEKNSRITQWRPQVIRRAAYVGRLVASVNGTVNMAAIPGVRFAPLGMIAFGKHQWRLRVDRAHS